MIDTKQKILDTAERLFAEQGYSSTSLRHIIAEAGVNLAAIHYHFGSKEDLLDQLVQCKATPVNAQRLALLDRFEAEAAPRPAPLEKVLEAFIAPAVLESARHPELIRLIGRLYGEGLMGGLVRKHFEPMVQRFLVAMRKAVPDLPEKELVWRLHFTVGSMAHTLAGPPEVRPAGVADAPESVAARLVAFLSGGFRAPIPETLEVVEETRA
jgi:AcrR family transcriptional regulator